MRGLAKVIGVLVVLALISSFFNTPSAEMTEDARRYVELEKEVRQARRDVLLGDSDRAPRDVIRASERGKALSKEMEAIKDKYRMSKVFKDLLEELKSQSE